eukprot:scaffold11028_cov93-Isochrysis_galbana.AAC.1
MSGMCGGSAGVRESGVRELAKTKLLIAFSARSSASLGLQRPLDLASSGPSILASPCPLSPRKG